MTHEATLAAVQAMRDVLAAGGWDMYYEVFRPCQCERYNHPDNDYEVHIKKNSSVAAIQLKGQTIAGWFHGYQLADKLKQFVK